ncbi:hypothetical protein JBE27_49540 [Streptomyces albiflaviniger]|nr:hypothetical protein [Streptomyces albiflaviniger]
MSTWLSPPKLFGAREEPQGQGTTQEGSQEATQVAPGQQAQEKGSATMANLEGEAKFHVEALLRDLGEAKEIIEYKDDEISELLRVACASAEEISNLEGVMVGLEDSHNLNISQIIKERDHARAKIKVLKNDKVEFEVGHNRLTEDYEKLKEEHKALESKFSILTKSHEQLQIN